MGRPVKFIADRFEAFGSDIHARDHRIKGASRWMRGDALLAFDIDDLTGIGPYSVYPRTSAVEGNQVVNLCGRPLQLPELSLHHDRRAAKTRRRPASTRRRPSHRDDGDRGPRVDLAAEALGMDPVEIRRKKKFPDDAIPAPRRRA